jgi:hypothetical protein
MKKLLIVLGVIAAVLILLVIGRNVFIKAAVETGVKAVTGLTLEMSKLDIGLFKTTLEIKGLKLYNPEGFKDKLMADLPEVYVDYSLRKIVQGKVYLPEVRLNLQQFTVVKNEKGALNLDSLAVVQQKKEGAAPAKQAAMPDLKIDSLRLDIGKVVYKDYSVGAGEPNVQTYDVNIHETFKNITDPQALVGLIVVKALGHTSIAALTGFDLKNLKQTAVSVLDAKMPVKVIGTLADTVGRFLPGDKK